MLRRSSRKRKWSFGDGLEENKGEGAGNAAENEQRVDKDKEEEAGCGGRPESRRPPKRLKQTEPSPDRGQEKWCGADDRVSRTVVPSENEVPPQDPLYAHIYDVVYDAYGLTYDPAGRSGTSLPAPNPVSLDRESLNRVCVRDEYHVALKTDGVRYLLVLTTDGEGAEVAVMVNRRGSMWRVHVLASPEHYDGSVFDGECMFDTETDRRLEYYVFDVAAFRGQNISHMTYTERLHVVRHTFGLDVKDYEEIILEEREEKQNRATYLATCDFVIAIRNNYCLTFRTKDVVPACRIGDLAGGAPRHRSDGYIFTPEHGGTGRWTNYDLFKFKTKHTLDFRMAVSLRGPGGSPVFRLTYGLGREERNAFRPIPLSWEPIDPEFAEAVYFELAPNALLRKLVSWMVETETADFDVIVECSVKRRPQEGSSRVPEPYRLTDQGRDLGYQTVTRYKATVEKTRNDKQRPNNLKTIQSTLIAIGEALSVEEVIQVCSTGGGPAGQP